MLTPDAQRSLTKITDAHTGKKWCGWCSQYLPSEGGKYFIRGKRGTKTWCCAGCREKKEKSK